MARQGELKIQTIFMLYEVGKRHILPPAFLEEGVDGAELSSF